MAASLLPSNTAAVGFGGYVGSSRVESSLSTEDAVPFLVYFFQSSILSSWHCIAKFINHLLLKITCLFIYLCIRVWIEGISA